MAPRASVIVRVKDEAATLDRALGLLREQTVPVEIVVVDSGSTDGSLEIARRSGDRLVQIAPQDFDYGLALNLGVEAASAPILFALSAHCFPPDPGWVERSLALYARADVAATNGATTYPDGTPLEGTYYQDSILYDDPAQQRRRMLWGFSNHASSWRRTVWEEFPFRVGMETAEDKEWAMRVVGSGSWVIAYRPDLMVSLEHRWSVSARAYFRRRRTEGRVEGRLVDLPKYSLRDLARDWWHDIPTDDHSAMAHRFANPKRLAGLLGGYVGRRDARHERARAERLR